jgi:murein endopeptidase
MGWRAEEEWLETELLWFREPAGEGVALLEAHAPSFAGLSARALTAAVPNGLAESRRRRAERRRRQTSRRTRTAALVIGPMMAVTLAAPRLGGARATEPLDEDPPSQTLRLDDVREAATVPARPEEKTPAAVPAPRIAWNRATSHGLHYAGRLSSGTRLPAEGSDWVTWNPVADRVPNRPWRLFGHERTIRAVVAVAAAYREAHPESPRIVIGDVSFREGGPMELHRSHQNGLDVDVYYPRRDGRERVPVRAEQVDRALSQDLLERFVAAGAKVVFVGYSTGLEGPTDVVVPYPNHGDHMHVRFSAP